MGDRFKTESVIGMGQYMQSLRSRPRALEDSDSVALNSLTLWVRLKKSNIKNAHE